MSFTSDLYRLCMVNCIMVVISMTQVTCSYPVRICTWASNWYACVCAFCQSVFLTVVKLVQLANNSAICSILTL